MASSKKRIVLRGGAVVIAAAGIYFYVWANRPATTTFSTSGTAEPKAVQAKNSQTFTGEYFTAKLPGELEIKTHSKIPQGITLERFFSVDSNHRTDGQLAITIGILPSEGIRGLSDITFRQRNPNYIPTKITAAPSGAIAFTKNNSEGYETSVFWAQGSKYAAVVVSSRVGEGNLPAQLNEVLKSWVWN